MNRYILFGWTEWQALGGSNDELGVFNSIEDAEKNIGGYEHGTIYSISEERAVRTYSITDGWENMND